VRTETNQQRQPFGNFFEGGYHRNVNVRGANISFSAGVMPGLFPFQLDLGGNQVPLTPEQQQQAQLSRSFLLIAFIILAATIFLS
jgi:hypothetical protein